MSGRVAAMGMRRLRLVVAYDGAAYAGWQVQKTGIGVQEKVEEALQRLFPGAGRLHGSSRTDAGVHARGMVAHVDLPVEQMCLPARKAVLALNHFLPGDVRVMQATFCRPDFHARFDARGKEYRYFIWNHPAMDPLRRRQAWHVPQRLDHQAMQEAARHFIGRHDFKTFATNRDYQMETTVRTLTRCSVIRSGPLRTVRMAGDGFLYKMCRGMVGTLAQVGLGRFRPDDVRRMLEGRDRALAGMNAPAHGLVLWQVFYGRKGGE